MHRPHGTANGPGILPRIYVVSPPGTQEVHEEAEARALWQGGRFAPEALYWREGMTEWQPLSSLFAVVPETLNPYAPPQAPPEAAPVAPSPTTGYAYTKDPRTLTSFVVTMLWLTAAAEGLAVLSEIAQIYLLSGTFTEEQGEANDLRQSLVGIGYLVVFLVTSVAFLKWIYRANLNSRGFGAEGMRFSPGWSIGFFFVPFLNLVRPFQAMKEIWQISANPKAWTEQKGSALLGSWWTLWLLSSVLGQVSFRASMRAETVDELQVSSFLGIAESLIGIPLSIVALKLVQAIASRQASLVSLS